MVLNEDINYRHYIMVHHGYLTASKARRRSRVFCEQYDMTEADREMANHRDCWQKCWRFCFSAAVFPKCWGGRRDEDD